FIARRFRYKRGFGASQGFCCRGAEDRLSSMRPLSNPGLRVGPRLMSASVTSTEASDGRNESATQCCPRNKVAAKPVYSTFRPKQKTLRATHNFLWLLDKRLRLRHV